MLFDYCGNAKQNLRIASTQIAYSHSWLAKAKLLPYHGVIKIGESDKCASCKTLLQRNWDKAILLL